MRIAYNFARFAILFTIWMGIVFPVKFQEVKMILLALTMSAILVDSFSPKPHFKLHTTIFALGLFFSAIGCIWSTYGVFNGNPGAVRVISVMVAYPLIFTLLGGIFRDDDYVVIMKFMRLSGFSVVLSQIAYLISSMGFDGGAYFQYIQKLYGDIAVVDSGEDYLLFTLPNVASLIFFLPFFLFHYLLEKKERWSSLAFIAAAILIVVMTGRRAFYVALPLAALVVGPLALLSKEIGIHMKRRLGKIAAASLILAFALLTNFAINTETYSQDIFSIFDFSTNESNIERKNQFNALIEGFQENPLFGVGAGGAASYSRSYEQPWAYELFYVALLFQYGLVGVTLYLIGCCGLLIWLALRIISQEKYEAKLFAACYLAGMSAFIFATATNPYLGKFDYMWVIFVPLAMLNASITKIRPANQS